MIGRGGGRVKAEGRRVASSEADPGLEPRDGARQQDSGSGVLVVVEGVSKHRRLKGLVDAVVAAQRSPLQQLDGDARVFQPVPHVPQLRRYRVHGHGVLDLPTGPRQLEVELEPCPDKGPSAHLVRKAA